MQLWKASHGKAPLRPSAFSIKIFDDPGEGQGPVVSVEPFTSSTPQPDRKGWEFEETSVIDICPAIQKNVEACLPGLKLTWTILYHKDFKLSDLADWTNKSMRCNGVRIEVDPYCIECHAERFEE